MLQSPGWCWWGILCTMPSWFPPLLLNKEQKTVNPISLPPSPSELISGWRLGSAQPGGPWESAPSLWGMGPGSPHFSGHPKKGLWHLRVGCSQGRRQGTGELVQLPEPPRLQREASDFESYSRGPTIYSRCGLGQGSLPSSGASVSSSVKWVSSQPVS